MKYVSGLALIFFSFFATAQNEMFQGTFTYDMYTVAKGEEALVSRMRDNLEKFTIVKFYISGIDTVYIENYTLDSIRESITIVTADKRVVFFDKDHRTMDLTKNSHESPKVKTRYKKLAPNTSLFMQLQSTWYEEISSVREGKILYFDEFPFQIPDVAVRYALYYDEKLGLVAKEETFYEFNELVGVNRFVELTNFEIGDNVKPVIPRELK